jgi:hypothetical protein
MTDERRRRRRGISWSSRGAARFGASLASGADAPVADRSSRLATRAAIGVTLGVLLAGILFNLFVVDTLLLNVQSEATTAVVTAIRDAGPRTPPLARVRFQDLHGTEHVADVEAGGALAIGRQVEVLYDPDDPSIVENAARNRSALLRSVTLAALFWLLAPGAVHWAWTGRSLSLPQRIAAALAGALVVTVWLLARLNA